MSVYNKGVHKLTERVHAYLQPDGDWGLSNSGLIRGERSALMVDTLFDAPLTRELLCSFEELTHETPIRYAVNTHGDGDHWFGNHQLPDNTSIIAAESALEDMNHLSPASLSELVSGGLPEPLNTYVQRCFGAFAFGQTEPRLPTDTFTDRLSLDVDGTDVNLIHVGPAHTQGDTLVHVPSENTVFAGDILFVGGTPIIWDGPVANWIAALDTILALDVEHIVPGHGPLTDRAGVKKVRRYLSFLQAQAKPRFEAGLSPLEAAMDIDLGEFSDWLAPERIVASLDRLYYELDPNRTLGGRLDIFPDMARYANHRRAEQQGSQP